MSYEPIKTILETNVVWSLSPTGLRTIIIIIIIIIIFSFHLGIGTGKIKKVVAFRIIISLLSFQTVWIWKCKDRHIPWHSPGHQAVWILDGTGQCGTSFHTIGFINLTYCKDKQDFTFTVTKSDSKFVKDRGHLQHLSPPPNSKRHFWLRICNFFPSCRVNDNNCFPVNDLSLCMYYFCMCVCWVI